MKLSYERLTGEAISSVLDEVARLRIAVFRDYPYLYDGDLDYERAYLTAFSAAQDAVVVVARDGQRIVGASTGCPMTQAHEEFRRPLIERGFDASRVFYCAESVMLAEFRGLGAGPEFFRQREDHARSLNAQLSIFCAVVRPANHPSRPADYKPLDAFWSRLGYAKIDGLLAQFSWRDIGDVSESKKPMQYWLKEL